MHNAMTNKVGVVTLTRHSLSATVFLSAFGGGQEIALGLETCLYPGPRVASTIEKPRRETVVEKLWCGQRHSL